MRAELRPPDPVPTAVRLSPAFSLFTSTVFGKVATKTLPPDGPVVFPGTAVLGIGSEVLVCAQFTGCLIYDDNAKNENGIRQRVIVFM
jgi:hypothetical protein